MTNRKLDENKKSRVAIGAFDRLESLSRTLEDLASRGVPHTTLMLLADAGALDGQLDAAPASRKSVDEGNWPAMVLRGAGSPIDPSADKEQPLVFLEQDGVVDFEQWIEPRMADRLNQQLAKGACLLFAVVATPDQEQKICQTLIQYSIGQVQVHDFWLEGRGI